MYDNAYFVRTSLSYLIHLLHSQFITFTTIASIVPKAPTILSTSEHLIHMRQSLRTQFHFRTLPLSKVLISFVNLDSFISSFN